MWIGLKNILLYIGWKVRGFLYIEAVEWNDINCVAVYALLQYVLPRKIVLDISVLCENFVACLWCDFSPSLSQTYVFDWRCKIDLHVYFLPKTVESALVFMEINT